MNSTVPAEVLALKSRFDQWRATRRHTRQRVPDELREAVVELAEQKDLLLVSNLQGDAPAGETPIGRDVEVCFEPIGDGFVLPQFRLAGQPTGRER